MLFRVVFIFRAQEVHSQRRHDGARPHIGSQHGETHRLGQGNEQELSHAGQKKHRDEDDANAERGNKCGHGDLLRAVEDRLDGFFAHREVAVDVFNFYRRVIDEDSDRECEPAKRHDIDGLAKRAETENADENRQRNRDGNDQRALPVSQEQQDHDRGEASGNDPLANHALDGGTNVERLVEESGNVQAFGERGFVVFEHRFDAVNDVNGRGAADFVDAHQHPTLAVGQHDVGLRGKAVAHMGDVLHINRRAIDGFDGEFVEFLDGLRAAVHLHVVFKRAELRSAGGEDQVLRVDRVYDIHRGKALGL